MAPHPSSDATGRSAHEKPKKKLKTQKNLSREILDTSTLWGGDEQTILLIASHAPKSAMRKRASYRTIVIPFPRPPRWRKHKALYEPRAQLRLLWRLRRKLLAHAAALTARPRARIRPIPLHFASVVYQRKRRARRRRRRRRRRLLARARVRALRGATAPARLLRRQRALHAPQRLQGEARRGGRGRGRASAFISKAERTHATGKWWWRRQLC
jgi:hypothetical protein